MLHSSVKCYSVFFNSIVCFIGFGIKKKDFFVMLFKNRLSMMPSSLPRHQGKKRIKGNHFLCNKTRNTAHTDTAKNYMISNVKIIKFNMNKNLVHKKNYTNLSVYYVNISTGAHIYK